MNREFLTRMGIDTRTANAILTENGRELGAIRASCGDKDNEISRLTAALEEKATENEKRLTALEAEHAKAVEAIRAAQERALENVRAEGEKKLLCRSVREMAKASGFVSAFAEEAAVKEAVSLAEKALSSDGETPFDAEEYFRSLSEKEPLLFRQPENELLCGNDDSEKFLPPLRFLRKRKENG